ncbi:MAG: DUF2281 domain-containing protein [Candidatus Cloacimonetes bacterium]|nr:DUF2281 domain-containing protein [Candidatus Cloacimonadota bacterium]
MTTKAFFIDADLESRASAVLNGIGINLQDAIVDYLNKIVQSDNSQTIAELKKEHQPETKKVMTLNDLPKEERERRLKIIHTKGPRSEARGVLKDLVWMSDDFDEPLDCMKEYME